MRFERYIDKGVITVTCIQNISGFLTKGKKYSLDVHKDTTYFYGCDTPGNVCGRTAELGQYFTIGCKLHKNIKVL